MFLYFDYDNSPALYDEQGPGGQNLWELLGDYGITRQLRRKIFSLKDGEAIRLRLSPNPRTLTISPVSTFSTRRTFVGKFLKYQQ